jgi:hypothetical protein
MGKNELNSNMRNNDDALSPPRKQLLQLGKQNNHFALRCT